MKFFTSIRLLYLTVFLLFFRASQKGWSYNMNIAKGTAGVTLVQGWLVIGIVAWIYYLTGHNILAVSKVTFYIVGLLAGMANYYVLVVRGHAIEFQREFTGFESRRKALLTAASVGVIAFSAAFALLSASYAHAHRALN